MQTDGLFTIHRINHVTQQNKPFRLVVFGDVHRDATLHAEDRWKEFLDYAKSLPPSTLFLGMGDYLDGVSTSERASLFSGGLHESTLDNFEREANGRVKQLYGELSFMSGRLIGLLGGNHFWPFPDGTTSDQRLAGMLKCRYLGAETLTRIVLSGPGSTARMAFDIYAHHGVGGSRLVGGSLNRVAQSAEWVDADIYLMGHDHQRGIIPLKPRVRLEPCSKQGLRLKERQSFVGRTGSFLLSRLNGHRSYIVDRAAGPSNLGHVEFEICLNRSQRKGATPAENSISIKGIS